MSNMEAPNINMPSSMAPSSSQPSAPNNHSNSAIIFSSTLIHHIEGHPSLRLPSTYVGVRRVRVSKDAAVAKKRKRLDSRGRGSYADDDVWVPNEIGPGKGSSGSGSASISESNTEHLHLAITKGDTQETNHNQNTANPKEIVYKITNPDGTQRRMTKQEKRQLKYQLSQAKHTARKEERQKQHGQRIQEAKEGKRDRKRLKRVAWKNKQKQKQENGDKEDGDRHGGDPEMKQVVDTNTQQQANEAKKKDDTITQMECNIFDDNVSTQSSLVQVDAFDEELAALRGERRGIPPVMLTPAATCVAQELGLFDVISQSSHRPSIKTTLNQKLSARWAAELQQSMVPAETSRGKEDMRPMAYRLVPEVWKRLCPSSLWSSNADQDTKKNTMDDSVKMNEDKSQTTSSTAADQQQQQQQQSYSLSLLRNPSPSYDADTYAIFRHLNQYSNLHLACGALFGCDFLLYDGRREERHSFAGLRVYSGSGNNRDATSTQDVGVKGAKFPIPTAYDMTSVRDISF